MPARDDAPAGAPCWIDLMTSDPERSHAFYGAVFGWVAEEGAPEFGGYRRYTRGGVPVAGVMANSPDSGSPDCWSVYLATDDADKLAEVTAARGGQVLAPPMAVGDLGTMVVLAAPDGAVVGAWQAGSFARFGVVEEHGAPAWFELHTTDHAGAVAYYRDAFGWQVEMVSDQDDFRYAVLASGGRQYAGIMDATAYAPAGTPAHWAVYLGASDVDAVVARVLEHGGSVVSAAEDTPYGRLAVVADPLGTPFRLVSQPSATDPDAG